MKINHKRTKHTEQSKAILRSKRPKVRIDKFDLDGNYIMTYECLQDIAREYGRDIRGNISKCCKGQIKKVYGFIWKYHDLERGV